MLIPERPFRRKAVVPCVVTITEACCCSGEVHKEGACPVCLVPMEDGIGNEVMFCDEVGCPIFTPNWGPGKRAEAFVERFYPWPYAGEMMI